MQIITSHVNMDFDGLAAMVGASKLHPGALLVLPGATDRNVREFLALHGDLLDLRSPKQIDLASVTRLIVVDTQTRSRLGDVERVLANPGVEVVVYNHHPQEQADFAATKVVHRCVGSTTTILVDEIRQRGMTVTPFEATLLAIGIYEDTGSLVFAGTTPADLECVAWLLRAGADLDIVADFIHRALTAEQRDLLNEIITTSRLVQVNGVPIAIASVRRPAYVSELALMAHKLADLENTPAVFVMASMEGTTYVVGRSNTDSLDVGEVMTALGGGGHGRAASAQLRAADLQQVERDLIAALRDRVRPELTAARIMSHPARTIGPDATVEDAIRAMQRYGHSGLCVVENGRLVGIITRRDADKARHHSLTHAPVKGFMTRHVVTATPDTPLAELERLMTRHDVGRLPVLSGDSIVGVVTRTDLLRALHGRHYAQRPKNITAAVESRLPPSVVALLRSMGAAAEDAGVPAYVVGGIVRDLLLGRRNLDVDVVVEGDAPALALQLAERVGARVKTHERFGTAVLQMPDGFRVDLASARTEAYRKPAALPEVERSSIQDDLRRRDFTINAMAIRIDFSHFGELLDPFGGKADLSAGLVRVMHNLSFVDDPTRILRAARFEARLGFRIDEQTEALAREAVAGSALSRLSPERLRRELMLCYSEPSPRRVLERLDQLGVLAHLNPAIHLNGELLDRVLEALHWFASLHQKDRPDREALLLAATLSTLAPEAAMQTCAEKLRLSPTRSALVAEMLARGPQVAAHAPALTTIELHDWLRPLPVEVLVYAAALNPQPETRGVIATFLQQLRHVRLQISGNDLVKLGYRPSPVFGRAMKEALAQKLQGRLRTKKEEREFIVSRLREAEAQVAT